jgi:ketosteroid isomerase-like protein
LTCSERRDAERDVARLQAFAGATLGDYYVSHMRSEFLIIIFITVSLNAFPQSPPLHSSNSADAATEVKLQEEALRQAELRYDVRAADALLSKDFVLTAASDGTLRSKSEFLPMIGDKSDPLEVLEYGAMQIRVYGDTAIVLSTIHEKAYYGGKPVEFRGRRTAVWVLQNQRWVCVTIHASSFPPK